MDGCCVARRYRRTPCSRLVGRLREDFAAWAKRDLGELKVRYLFLDGWYARVRIGKKRVRVPGLVTLGVCAGMAAGGTDLRLAGVESEPAWLDGCARWSPAISTLRRWR